MQTILYVPVSISDQIAVHQRTHAEAAGFNIDEVVTDQAMSGVTVPFRERSGQPILDTTPMLKM